MQSADIVAMARPDVRQSAGDPAGGQQLALGGLVGLRPLKFIGCQQNALGAESRIVGVRAKTLQRGRGDQDDLARPTSTPSEFARTAASRRVGAGAKPIRGSSRAR